MNCVGGLELCRTRRVRAGLVENSWDWERSGAPAHINGADCTGLLDMPYWQKHFDSTTWGQFLFDLILSESVPARYV